MRPALPFAPWNRDYPRWRVGADPAYSADETVRTIVVRRPAPCCMRRARQRYWRIARGYAALGAALGVAVGMLLGAASKVCQ